MMMNNNKNKMEPPRKDVVGCPNLQDREWIEDKKLELRLGPPDDIDWNTTTNNTNTKRDTSFCSCLNTNTANTFSGNRMGFSSNGGPKIHNNNYPHLHQSSYSNESSHYCCCGTNTTSTNPPANTAGAAVIDNKAFSPPAIAQKRTGPAPVVGWPPVRSFRRNLAGSSTSNLNPNHNGVFNKICNEKQQVENNQKGLFVKINMDGVPIGRKVDLKVYDSYEKLSSAVDDLFRGLLAAQGDTLAGCGTMMKGEGEKVISGELDGSGEYALVYEDNEGDRMLVGDVPWQMFISTVKRLRVLKTADISKHCKGSKAKELRT